ncbi:MAG: GxxExxY protein [Kiritimatiellia bacterium]|jgi:GxxExxY protein|nr:GxxExxY protein [Kiritimatiellia bacterium]
MKCEMLTKKIIGAAIAVHNYWGPGLYEEIYEKSLCHELKDTGLPFESQIQLPLEYKGKRVGDDLRLDLLVEERVVVELKVVIELKPIHKAQLLTYMRLSGCHVGLLINFNVVHLRDGIRRLVI